MAFIIRSVQDIFTCAIMVLSCWFYDVTEVEGIYLFTSGIPDQQADVCCSYVEEACAGRKLKVTTPQLDLT